MHTLDHEISDIFVIGGGVNGCGIARDAVGRGFRVVLAEMGDIGGGTSSASTKLFHGGLRYLEYFELRLVREALKEREVLLTNMPHISWPMRFVLPLRDDMRFDVATPASKVLGVVMPWLKGRRPAWVIRLGLYLYDTLGGRKILPPTTSLTLPNTPEGVPLHPVMTRAYEYSDCWVQDARLVVLNARDAHDRGAEILPRTKVMTATPENGVWKIETRDQETGAVRTHVARLIVNAAGPWVGQVLGATLGQNSNDGVRLVRGSHIVTKRLFDHDKAYFFQGSDGRIIFAIPYESDFTLIGTTDAEHVSADDPPRCSDKERNYLIDFMNNYMKSAISKDDVIWSYSGVRPLYDDGASNASAATREYVIKSTTSFGAPVVSVFGGKITTYRRLAEAVLDKVQSHLGRDAQSWTKVAPLPGGDFPVTGVDAVIDALCDEFLFMDRPWATRLVRCYGTDARKIYSGATSVSDLGEWFGSTLFAAEVIWLMTHEFARTAEDVVWRRTKLGLHLNNDQIESINSWMADRLTSASIKN